MTRSIARTLAALLLLAAAAAASADITDVSSKSIAEGSTFTITGTGFGKSPTVELVSGETRIALKRQKKPKASDTSLTVLVTKAPAGTYTLELKPKGGATAMSFPGVVVEVPRSTALSSPSAAPGDVVTVSGSFLGKSKGAVRVGCAFLKPKKWDWKNGAVTFVVPVGLLVEQHDVAIVNGSGDAGNANAVTLAITQTGGTGESVRATLGAHCLHGSQPNTRGYLAPEDPDLTRLTLDAYGFGFGGSQHLTMQVLIPEASTFPVTVLGSASYSVFGQGEFLQNYNSRGKTTSITVTGIDGGFLEGTFTGTLRLEQGMGSLGSTIQAAGKFRAKIE